MIVCHCAVVTDRDVEAAVDSGNASLSAVCRTTGAGQDCGACIFSVKALVCQHRQERPDIPEVDRAAS
ncbi:(2Fe-2S)-binding protein [Kribbia dieselivorans]|uniref:(2Fe-2S)-binding protein n=1 Tax=Kribbia dieselivorans TaxID=331526 RepID=UPI0008386E3E|nr:(2Fe-2S)-binding protein [Kribbia dieselivorans]